MKLLLEKEKIEFDFPGAIELFKFDEEDKASPYYHGVSQCMKAVDVIGVFEKYQVWIEIKDGFSAEDIAIFESNPYVVGSKKHKGLALYLDDLKVKFRDTFLYRHCEDRLSLPIVYVFLTNMTDGLCLQCKKVIAGNIPTGNANSSRWSKQLLDKDYLFVVSIDKWNKELSYIGTCTKQP